MCFGERVGKGSEYIDKVWIVHYIDSTKAAALVVIRPSVLYSLTWPDRYR